MVNIKVFDPVNFDQMTGKLIKTTMHGPNAQSIFISPVSQVR